MAQKTQKSRLTTIVGALLVPVILLSICISFTRLLNIDSGLSLHQAAMIFSVAFGGCCVLRFPWPLFVRLLALVVYLPSMWVVLDIYSPIFLCEVFHDCPKGV